MLLPAPRSLRSVIGCRLGDAVERQVVDVDAAVRWAPGEGEGGGVGRGDSEIADRGRTCATNRGLQVTAGDTEQTHGVQTRSRTLS